MSIVTVSVSPVPALPTTSVYETTWTEPGVTLSCAAVNVAVAEAFARRPGQRRQAAAQNVERHRTRYDRLREREGHHRTIVAIVQRGVDDVDIDRRVAVSIVTVSVSPMPALPTTSVYETTWTEPGVTLSCAAVNVAVAEALPGAQVSADGCRPERRAPPNPV